MSSAAAKLKDEGNSLFNEKDYESAIEKYIAAIVKDPRNAILYCNRAACHHVLKKWARAALTWTALILPIIAILMRSRMRER